MSSQQQPSKKSSGLSRIPLLILCGCGVIVAASFWIAFRPNENTKRSLNSLQPSDLTNNPTGDPAGDQGDHLGPTSENAQLPLAFLASYQSPVVSKNPGFVGPDACRECHQENHASATQTNHFRACRIVKPDDMPDGFDGDLAKFASQQAPISFEMRQQGDKFWMDTIDTKGAPRNVASSRLDLVLGAGGKFDDVFLSWRDDGWMFELPMVWLYPSSQWATSHFDPYSDGDHSRPLTVRCLECHNTWVNHVVGTGNQYLRDELILGVTCESCHGPGQQHVQFHRENPGLSTASHIVAPRELNREQKIAICSQCHSNAMKRRTVAFGHRPDQPVEASFRDFTSEHHEDDHVANQTRFMRESKCFQASDKMTCITCHDPHNKPAKDYLAASGCYQCHQADDCHDRPNLPQQVRDQCVECHMPPYIKINVNFRTQDDNFVTPIRRWQHNIGIYPEAKQEILRDWFAAQSDDESQQQARQLTDELLAFYYAQFDQCNQEHRYLGAIAAAREAMRIEANDEVRQRLNAAVAKQSQLEDLRARANKAIGEGQFAEAIPLLKKVLELKPDDAIAHGRLGTAYAQTANMTEAIGHWDSVQKHDPDDVYGLGMLAWLANSQGRQDEALALFLKADTIEPYEAKVKNQIGLILARQGKLTEALPYFDYALRIEPLHPGALQGIISTLRSLKRPEEAIPYAQTAVVLTRLANPDALMVLAETNFEAQKLPDAIEAAKVAQSLCAASDPSLAAKIEQRILDYRQATQR